MNLMDLIRIPVSDEHRRKVLDAQYVLGPDYVDFVWLQRMREHPVKKRKRRWIWPLDREATNVLPMKAKKK